MFFQDLMDLQPEFLEYKTFFSLNFKLAKIQKFVDGNITVVYIMYYISEIINIS